MSRKARWCFTVNNWTDNDVDHLRKIGSEIAPDGYLLFGYETAPSTNTRHLQGYIRTRSPRTFQTIKVFLPAGAHIEPAIGTENQNFRYCTKSGHFEEFGSKKSQGQRSDLKEAIHSLLHDGQSLLSVAENHSSVYVRYFRGLHELRNIVVPIKPRDFRSNVYIFYGPTRTGKSRFAASIAGSSTVYYKNRSNWWHGYKQEDTVIIDDFYGWLKWDELLKICDRYPYKVETKGGFEEFTSKTIIITSNQSPSSWYKFDGFDVSPLLSDRINATIETETTPFRVTFYNSDYIETDKEMLNKHFCFE